MQLTSCCGCYSVRTGTIIIGILDIILSIISLVLIFVLNVEWKTILLDVDQDIVKIIYAINLCMTILIAVLLLVGVYKKNTFMMLPWVILGLILAVGLLVSIVYTAIMFFINHDVISGVVWLVTGFISLVIYIYMWLVVYSHFQQLRYDKMNGRIGPYGKPYNYRRP
ncbi:uncharacterized protein LOC143187042 [Calliopsis andreniformis]|uniref:uncharacterized protein LOC143187042 n=1 Tax=Calliopsis andreniformis TaxID=337506 RepID=UPI003FCDB273